MARQKRRRFLALAAGLLCFALTACQEEPALVSGDQARLPDVRPQEIQEKRIAASGEIRHVLFEDFGFLAYSYDGQASHVAFFDWDYEKLWEEETDGRYQPVGLFSEELTLVRTKQGLAAYNGEGNRLWTSTAPVDLTGEWAAFPDGEGGARILSSGSPGENCELYHVSWAGGWEMGRYSGISAMTPLQSYVASGKYWLYGTRDKDAYRFIARLSADLEVECLFKLEPRQYPDALFYPDGSGLLLYGQAYDEQFEEYGFMYRLTQEGEQLAYAAFESVPSSAALLEDGRIAASFYYRDGSWDTVKILDEGLQEVGDLPTGGYTSARLFPCGDQLIVTGMRPSPEQFDRESDWAKRELAAEAVFPTRRDTVVEIYNSRLRLLSRKTYSPPEAGSQSAGREFVTPDGQVLVS